MKKTSYKDHISDVRRGVEKSCESERREAYLMTALQFGEDIITFPEKLKDDMRSETNASLERKKDYILRLWDTLEHCWRMTFYRILIAAVALVSALMLALIIFRRATSTATSWLGAMLVLSIIIVIICFIRNEQFFIDPYVELPKVRSLIDDLLSSYNDYGRMESIILLLNNDPPQDEQLEVQWLYSSDIKDFYKNIGLVVD